MHGLIYEQITYFAFITASLSAFKNDRGINKIKIKNNLGFLLPSSADRNGQRSFEYAKGTENEDYLSSQKI